ncbi:hypothetical protein ACFOTA_15345 [Chitinophaga sp. GCM10012297]|uniref:Tetratricopeptide repeat protein n=1 Tax=Chitinophaga chungangae TaxID=2821488 RepID=A0ABS3YGL1_9BACT|nr:hypothetical protein [Chitinophaga chungangae]MBO9153595.1 hypothetical protein [Chitinophaga chungangae]
MMKAKLNDLFQKRRDIFRGKGNCLLLFILLSTFFVKTSFAQLAKMQFEDAEAAYNEGKYAEAVKLLDEAERSNKGANPPIMYLRILSRVELIKQNPEKDFDLIDKARKESNLFLKTYNGNAQLEDKYREVYQASKVLKDLPLTREAFEESLVNKKQAAAEAERIRKEKLRLFHSDDLTQGFKKGSLEEYRKIYQVKKASVFKMPNGDRQIYVRHEGRYYYIYFRNGEAYGYSTTEEFKDDEAHQAGKRIQAKKIAHFNNAFGFAPESEVQKYVKSTTTGTKYKWAHGNTVFYMEVVFYVSGGAYKCSIDYYNFDKRD